VVRYEFLKYQCCRNTEGLVYVEVYSVLPKTQLVTWEFRTLASTR